MDVNPIIEMDFEPVTQASYRADSRPTDPADGGFLAAVKWACLGDPETDGEIVPMRRAIS